MKGILVFMFLLLSVAGWGEKFYRNKEEGVGLAWLKLAPSARGIALGNAYISVVDEPTASWWNPGALGKIEGMHTNFTHMQYFMGIRYEFLGLSINKGKNAYGVTLNGIFINGFDCRNEQQDSLGEFSAYDFLTAFSYARTLAEGLYLGGTLKGIRERIYIYESSALLVDFGVSYTAMKNLWFGATLVNLSNKYPKFEEEEIKPPRGWKIGSSYKNRKALLSIDVSKYIDAVMQVGIGAEYELLSVISLRAGYTSGSDSYSLSTGLGITLDGIRIDYAFRPYNKNGIGLNSAHIFTLTK
jgi:hypothetical protein